jgi:hypothetical protein
MPTQEIPHDQWKVFFDSFSRQHEGWLTTMEVFSDDVGAQREAEELPFEGISFNTKGTAGESILISVARSEADHVTHVLEHPTHVWLQRAPEETNESLELIGNDDSKILLRLRSPRLSEFVGETTM